MRTYDPNSPGPYSDRSPYARGASVAGRSLKSLGG